METWRIVGAGRRLAAALVGVVFGTSLLAGAAIGQTGGKPADGPPAAASSRVEAAIANILQLVRPDEDGVATIWDGNKFVQCRHMVDDVLRCEAAGALMQPTLASVLTPARVAALASAGWRLDPSFGNYVQSFSAKLPAAEIAGRLLAALTTGYDADLTEIGADTTWIAREACPPRAGVSQNLAGSINESPAMVSAVVTGCKYVAAEPDATPVTTLDALVARAGPRLTGEIGQLRVNAGQRVFAAFSTGLSYVQCAPEIDPLSMYCEAQSIEEWPALAAVLTPDRIARLHALGFSDPGRAPNYWRSYDADKYSDEAIATSLLTVLFDCYGYRGAPALKITTEQ